VTGVRDFCDESGGDERRPGQSFAGSLLYASPLPQSRSGLGPWNTEAAIQLVDAPVNLPPHF
jgi:hypothetical protein